MYKSKSIRDKKGKVIGGAYMMKNRAGDQAITAETGEGDAGKTTSMMVHMKSRERECLAIGVRDYTVRGPRMGKKQTAVYNSVVIPILTELRGSMSTDP